MSKEIKIQFSIITPFEIKYIVEDEFVLNTEDLYKAEVEISSYLGKDIYDDFDEISDKEPEDGSFANDFVSIDLIEVKNSNNEIEFQLQKNT
jgi:hypothetical protein